MPEAHAGLSGLSGGLLHLKNLEHRALWELDAVLWPAHKLLLQAEAAALGDVVLSFCVAHSPSSEDLGLEAELLELLVFWDVCMAIRP